MDIAGLSMSMAYAKTNNQVGTAMLAKAMDSNEAAGEGLVQMMNQAPAPSLEPGVGQNFDMRI